MTGTTGSGTAASRSDGGRLSCPALLVHGGAGAFERVTAGDGEEVLLEALYDAIDAGWAVLSERGPATAAAVEAVATLEDGGHFNAGRGAVPTTEGRVELDASVMDAATGAFGALCAATYPANPVRAALAIAQLGGVPDGPVLLAGSGADRFCEDQRLMKMEASWLKRLEGGSSASAVLSREGTVGAVALDFAGGIGAATSTGGRLGQRPGRVGDSPIPGAGVLAVPAGSRGSQVGVSATGAGEAFLVSGFAHKVAWLLDAGHDLAGAVEEALRAVSALSATGGAIALTSDGTFVTSFTTPAMARGWRCDGESVARVF